MTNQLIIVITSLIVLIFIVGCQQAKFEPIEPNQTNTLQVPIHRPESNEVEPTTIETLKLDTAKNEPNEIEPDVNEPSEIELATAEPNDAEAIGVKKELFTIAHLGEKDWS